MGGSNALDSKLKLGRIGIMLELQVERGFGGGEVQRDIKLRGEKLGFFRAYRRDI